MSPGLNGGDGRVRDDEKLAILRRTELTSRDVNVAIDAVIREGKKKSAGEWYAQRLVELADSPDDKIALGALKLAREWVTSAEKRALLELEGDARARGTKSRGVTLSPDLAALDHVLKDLEPEKRRAILEVISGVDDEDRPIDVDAKVVS